MTSGGTHARRRHTVRNTLIALAVIGFGTAGAISSLSSPNKIPGAGGPTPVAHVSKAPSTTPSVPAVTVTRTVSRIVFRVWGHAVTGADITYGSDSDSRTPHGGEGLDGTGTRVPWHGSVKYRSNYVYYAVSAQLNGSGNVTCAVIARVTAFYSDGTHKTMRKRLATGHASGGYEICQAETT